MYLFSMFGTIVIGALVGFLTERFGLTRNGTLVSIILGLGGAVLAYLVSATFGIGFGGRSVTAAIGAGAALFLAPMIGRNK